MPIEEDGSRTFHLSPKELAEACKWIAEHFCKLRGSKNIGAIGGKTTFTFTSTSIGQLAGVKCACGNSTCVTDLETL